MTLTQYFVNGIYQINQGAVTIQFKEKISNKTMETYLETIQKDWVRQGFGTTMPIETMAQYRQKRLDTTFQMNFAALEWAKLNLKMNDLVEINIPVSINDIKPIENNFGV